MKNSLLKYKIGLVLIAIFAIGLLVFVLSEASATKQDADTFNTASKIASKLNNYVASKQTIPSSLSAAGISDTPGAVSYKKLSDSKYSFCVTYKTKSTNFSASDVEANLLTSSIDSGGDAFSGQSSDNTELFLDGTHNKGQQCQTVKPSIVDFNSGTPSTGSSGDSDPFAKCDSIQDNTAWQSCINQVDQGQQTDSSALTE
jgi:hypothetical protein